MCSAGAAAGVAIGSQVLGTGLTLWGNQISANASAEQAKLQAKLKEREAAEIGRAGRIAVERMRIQGRQAEASQRTGYAGAGVDVGAGTAADVQQQTGVMAETDATELKHKYAMERWSKKAEASALRHGVELQRKYGWISGATTILGGVSGVAGTYSDWRTSSGGGTQNMAQASQNAATQSNNPYRQYYDKKQGNRDWTWG